MFLIFSLLIYVSLLFIVLNHPLTMALTLIIMSTLIALLSGMLLNSFWFSYMLFLIMVGGMLVVFIYMTSVASNEKFSINLKILLSMILMIFMFPIFNIYIKNYMNMTTLLSIKSHESMMIKFMIFPYLVIIIMMMIYLLITMIATVKITQMNFGPLRQKY